MTHTEIRHSIVDRPALGGCAMSDPLRILTELLSEDAARAVLASLEGHGYVCVPIQPSEQMLYAASDFALDEDAGGVWKSMINEYLSHS